MPAYPVERGNNPIGKDVIYPVLFMSRSGCEEAGRFFYGCIMILATGSIRWWSAILTGGHRVTNPVQEGSG